MLAIVFAVSALVAVSVNSCTVTSFKRYGEKCSCKDGCLDGAYCLRDKNGGLSCSCLPCQYYDQTLRQCVNTPDYGETCNGVCSSNYTCLNSPTGCTTCQCLSNQIYNATIQACVNIPRINEPCTNMCAPSLTCVNSMCRCPSGSRWNSTDEVCRSNNSPICLSRTQTNCQGYASKNYPACFPECKDGIFITCSNGYIFVRDCALSNYKNGLSKLVYEPTTDRCEYKTPYCPRDLDLQIIQ
ncbi:unnamed protein product [Lymnaea stagnalis]|uniref:Uncharacterized protein n=1 Tax=Lymnaea stagnalis TaxID=6523 RepID=A0AAV2HBF5_LYMST